MNLQLFVREKLITTIPLSNTSISNPLYLTAVKIELQEKYKEIIEGLKAEPTFNLVPNTTFYGRKNRGLNLPLL